MKTKALDIRKVLIPIDFSETSMLAIEHGAFMAKLYKADVILVHVVEHSWQKFSIVAPEIKFELPENILSLAEAKLKEVASKIRKDYGVTATAISSQGNICGEIVELVNTEKADIIVMGTQGASGLQEVFMGSNSYKVVTLAQCPILTVQSHSRRIGFSEILLPIDNSGHSRQKVGYTVELAKHYGSRIHILGLLDEDDSQDLDKFKIKIQQVKDFVEKCEIPSVVDIQVGGNQAKNTIDYAKKHNAELIVIMTDQEENFTGSFLGPYAQQVVNHSWVPVLSFKPVENPGNISWTYPYN
ncbi:MAG: universal stress protein [Bacteroidetes bacterium]|nr:universal stress protein [Bacteroidota bacterium]